MKRRNIHWQLGWLVNDLMMSSVSLSGSQVSLMTIWSIGKTTLSRWQCRQPHEYVSLPMLQCRPLKNRLTDIQVYRQADRQTGGQMNRQREKNNNRWTDWWIGQYTSHPLKKKGGLMSGHGNRKIKSGHVNRWCAHRETGWQADRQRETGGQKHRWADRYVDR